MPLTSLIKIHHAFIVVALIPTCIVSSKYLLIGLKQGTGRVYQSPKGDIVVQEGENPPVFEDKQGIEK